MSNLVSQEQARIDNKISNLTEDIRIKFPDPTSSVKIPAFANVGNIDFSQPNKIDLQPEIVDTSNLYKTLPSGERIAKFDSYISGVNEEQRQALQQTTTNKWLNGMGKFLGKTGTAIVGGTVGSIYGIFDAVKEGSVEAIWNNDFNNYLDDLNTKMDYKLPNYYTEQEKDLGFLGSTGTANFWANDFLGGLSFTVGTVVSEAAWATATGGTSLITTAGRVGARAANALGKAKSITKGIKDATKVTKDFIKKSALDYKRANTYGKAAQALNTARFTYTSAGYEAGFEARNYLREQKEQFEQNFEKVNGRAPTIQDRLEFNQNLDSSANTLFATNLALVGGSNLAIFGKMYNITSPIKAPTTWLNKKLFGVGVNKTKEGTFESIKRSQLQKVLGTSYSIFKAPFVEGVIEEGGQAVASTSAAAFLEAQYNNQKPAIDLVESMYEGLSETYGTKEGWKEVGLGMLIGLVGGQASNVASGREIFSDISNLKKLDEATATARNLYSSEKVIELITKNAVIAKANEEAEKAADRGDLTTEKMSNDMAMLANIMMAEKFDYSDDARKDLETIADLISDETIQEQYGVQETEEIEVIRQDIKSNYSSLQESYRKNIEFANYQIGEQQLPEGLGITLGAQQLREMLAYQLTMAESAEKFSDDLVSEIKREVLEFTSPVEGFTDALDLQNALLKAGSEKRREYNNLKKSHKRTAQKLDLAEKRSRSIQNEILVREEAKDLARELSINDTRIRELQLELDKTKSELEAITEGVLVSSPFREGSSLVRTSDLLDIDESLVRLQKEVNNLKSKDPVKASKIEKLTEEYKKAISATRGYGNIVNGLLNPQTGFRGDSRTFLSGRKPLNQATLDFLLELQNANEEYKKIESRFETQQTVSQPEENTQGDDINKTTTQETQTQVSLDPVDTLRNKLNELLTSNSYLLDYFGEDLQEKKPTVEDFQEFAELKNKYSDVNIDLLINVDPTRLSQTARGGLGLAEITRYQQLARKMANWRLLDGVESEGVSILDLINQIDALENPVEPNSILETETTKKEDLEIALETKSIEKNEVIDPSIMQSYDSVLVLQKPNYIELTHINLDSFIKKGATIKENGKPVANIDRLQKVKGRSFLIDFGDVVVPAKIVEHSRIRIEKENVQDLLDKTGMKIVDTSLLKERSWSSVYEQNEDGTYRPIKTDYVVDPSEAGFSMMSPEEVYNIEQGEPIFFKVSLQDSWNLGFQKEIQDLDISNETQVKDLKSKLRNQVQVYVVNQENEVAAVLKAGKKNSTQKEFLAIRQKAADVIFETYRANNFNKVVYDLPYSVIADSVYVGMPNLTLVENNGQLSPVKTEFTEDTIQLVEGYGIASNGAIQQSPNSEVPNENINTQFIQNIDGTKPVAIIRYNKQLIAYPITVKKRESLLFDQVSEILTSDLTNSQKVTEISKILAGNGIDPKQYNLIQTGDISFIGSANQSKLLEDLQNLERSITPEEFLSEEYTKENLLADGSITVNLSNKPFLNPKLKVDYSSMANVTALKSTEEDIFDRTGKVLPSVLNEIVNKQINQENLSEFQQNVVNSQPELVEQAVSSKLEMSEENQGKSNKEKNKKC